MSKKDRIAIVLSSLYILIPLFIIMYSIVVHPKIMPSAFMLLAFLIIYWGVRFIKNNISFLKEYNNNDE